MAMSKMRLERQNDRLGHQEEDRRQRDHAERGGHQQAGDGDAERLERVGAVSPDRDHRDLQRDAEGARVAAGGY